MIKLVSNAIHRPTKLELYRRVFSTITEMCPHSMLIEFFLKFSLKLPIQNPLKTG